MLPGKKGRRSRWIEDRLRFSQPIARPRARTSPHLTHAGQWGQPEISQGVVAPEVPARDGAEIRKQVLQGPVGARLLREMQSHDRQFHRAYAAFLKGRDRTANTGLLAAQAIVNVHEGEDESTTTVPPVAGLLSLSVEQGVALLKQRAAAPAPGGENGIGAPIARGDVERAAVMVTGPLSPDELTGPWGVEENGTAVMGSHEWAPGSGAGGGAITSARLSM